MQPQSMKQCEDHPLNPNPESQWQSFFKGIFTKKITRTSFDEIMHLHFLQTTKYYFKLTRMYEDFVQTFPFFHNLANFQTKKLLVANMRDCMKEYNKLV